jgi:hypothetical protein
VRNFRHRLQMVIEADGVYTYWKMCLHDCESTKTTELKEMAYSDICHVLTKLYTIIIWASV